MKKSNLFLIICIILIGFTSAAWYDSFTWFTYDENNENITKMFSINLIKENWETFKQTSETDYNEDGIPDVISTFNFIDENTIEIYVNDTRETGGYKWASAICNISNVDQIQKEEYNPKTDVWTNTGDLNYGTLWGLPEDWCPNHQGFSLYGAGSGDKQYRLIFPEGKKQFTIFSGKGSEEINIVYQNESMVQFSERDLEINNTLKKWNGEEFVISPEDIWIKQPNNNTYKFGANDTIAKENTMYRYEWKSNKEIKYDGYYYFDEFKTGETQHSNLYSRSILDVSDICINDSDCIFELVDENTLFLTFTGYYNSTLDMIFIDPSYSYTNVSTEVTLTENIRSEPTYSHLAINDPNLIFYMPFDIDDSTQYDYSNNNNDGIVTNSTFNTSCKYGSCFTYNGARDYIYISNDVFATYKTYSISLWLRRANGGSGYVFNANRPFLQDYGATMVFKTNGVNNAFPVTSEEWHHLVLIADGVNNKSIIYVDGAYVQNKTDVTGTNSNLYIGTNGAAGVDWEGEIDDFAIWNRTLSADEILKLYNSTFQKFYTQGNQTFKPLSIELGSDNRINLTIEGNALNDSNLTVGIYAADLSDGSGYVNTETNLVGYWHLDNDSVFGESDSLVYDFSGNGNNGTPVNNAIPTSDGYINGAYEFDGVDGIKIDTGDISSVENINVLTVGAWIKHPTGDVLDTLNIISKEGGGSDTFTFEWLANENIQCKISNSTTVATSEFINGVEDADWHYVVCRYNGTNVEIFIDGQAGSSTPSLTGGTLDTSHAVTIGSKSTNVDAFNGSIDEVAIWNRTLSADEIKLLYSTGSSDYKNDGVGIDWIESSTGTQELITLNSTHLRASDFVVDSTSTHLLTELEYDSTYGFYSSVVGDILVDTYEGGEPADNPPTYSNIATNNTQAGQSTNFSILWDDDVALESNGQYIFSTNNTGVWVNESAVNFTATPSAANVIKVLNSTGGLSIGYRWYATDNAGNLNDTGIQVLTTTGADSCTYTSGDWNVDCSDNCVISSPVNVGGNNIFITGTGTFLTSSDISNYGRLHIQGTDSSNICKVTCNGGCFI